MKKMRKGFTLIELMIVIAIISIIAAIAIPNLMQSRIRANEAAAISALKNYCNAQVTFQVGRQGRYAANTSYNGSATGYCVEYPNLFYGNPAADGNGDEDSNLALISKAHADAWIVEYPNVNDGNPTEAGDQAAYQGYLFGDPVEMAQAGAWDGAFSQLCAPSLSGSTGNSMFWVGTEGTVYTLGLVKGKTASDVSGETTPLDSAGYGSWYSL